MESKSKNLAAVKCRFSIRRKIQELSYGGHLFINNSKKSMREIVLLGKDFSLKHFIIKFQKKLTEQCLLPTIKRSVTFQKNLLNLPIKRIFQQYWQQIHSPFIYYCRKEKIKKNTQLVMIQTFASDKVIYIKFEVIKCCQGCDYFSSQLSTSSEDQCSDFIGNKKMQGFSQIQKHLQFNKIF
ncbi:unnamed protein product [Paramecium primaurelia]|uniref:Uncharacterized protein n=1 Tax=Paramecium primaurelia TaxID=5886 RepID=A0A8S1NKB5_PARPR|nr:unnamed protein product [Paramecium primaurelia]